MKVLIFGAAWCASCQLLKRALADQAFPGFTVEYVDADAQPDLVDQHAVKGLPTVVVPDAGVRRTGITGLTTFRRLLDDVQTGVT